VSGGDEKVASVTISGTGEKGTQRLLRGNPARQRKKLACTLRKNTRWGGPNQQGKHNFSEAMASYKNFYWIGGINKRFLKGRLAGDARN